MNWRNVQVESIKYIDKIVTHDFQSLQHCMKLERGFAELKCRNAQFQKTSLSMDEVYRHAAVRMSIPQLYPLSKQTRQIHISTDGRHIEDIISDRRTK